jgi:hypothetical protein
MGTVAYWMRSCVELLLYPFDRLPRFWSLSAIAVLTALLMVVIVGRVTPQARIRRARARIAAAIYEIRLYLDSPRRMLAAQATLLKYSIFYVLLLVPALLVLAPILGLLYLHLDVRFGLVPAQPDTSVIVKVAIDREVDGYQVAAAELPDGLDVTAPPVYVEDEARVYLRVDVRKAGVHTLPIDAAGHRVTKEIVARRGAAKVVPERRRAHSALWAFGHERPLPGAGPVQMVSVAYPEAEQKWIGLSIPWWLYWLLLATLAALVLTRPLRVAL